MTEALYYDRLTGRMAPVERRPLLDHIYEQRSPAGATLELYRRLAELERRGA